MARDREQLRCQAVATHRARGSSGAGEARGGASEAVARRSRAHAPAAGAEEDRRDESHAAYAAGAADASVDGGGPPCEAIFRASCAAMAARRGAARLRSRGGRRLRHGRASRATDWRPGAEARRSRRDHCRGEPESRRRRPRPCPRRRRRGRQGGGSRAFAATVRPSSAVALAAKPRPSPPPADCRRPVRGRCLDSSRCVDVARRARRWWLRGNAAAASCNNAYAQRGNGFYGRCEYNGGSCTLEDNADCPDSPPPPSHAIGARPHLHRRRRRRPRRRRPRPRRRRHPRRRRPRPRRRRRRASQADLRPRNALRLPPGATLAAEFVITLDGGGGVADCEPTPADVKGPFHLPPEEVPAHFPARSEACVLDPACASCASPAYADGLRLQLRGSVRSSGAVVHRGRWRVVDIWQSARMARLTPTTCGGRGGAWRRRITTTAARTPRAAPSPSRRSCRVTTWQARRGDRATSTCEPGEITRPGHANTPRPLPRRRRHGVPGLISDHCASSACAAADGRRACSMCELRAPRRPRRPPPRIEVVAADPPAWSTARPLGRLQEAREEGQAELREGIAPAQVRRRATRSRARGRQEARADGRRRPADKRRPHEGPAPARLRQDVFSRRSVRESVWR